MPSYYVPKKNRCSCSDGSCCDVPIFLNYSTLSSINASVEKSKTVYYTDTQNASASTTITGKGVGNVRKQGSGGNSYDAYLAKKKGLQYCNCN